MKFPRQVTSVLLLLLAFITGNSRLARAQSNPNGVALCIASNAQLTPQVLSDGSSGAYVTWVDNRFGQICYAQRVNSTGVPQWLVDGIALSTVSDANLEVNQAMASDGVGGAFVAWAGGRPRVQRINASGMKGLGVDGLILTTANEATRQIAIAPDGAGGVISAWSEEVGSGQFSVFAQRMNSTGMLLWGATGSQVYASAILGDVGTNPALVSDGAGGAIVAWKVKFGGIRLQRINAAGTLVGSQVGLAPGVGSGTTANGPTIVSDGVGGAIVSWYTSLTNGGVYAQRVSAAGVAQWSPVGAGVQLSVTAGGNRPPRMISDGTGGVIVTWQDLRSVTNYDVYAQSLSGAGALLWTATGVPMCTAPNDQDAPTIISDGSGGAIVTWYDARSGSGADIYAQRVNSSGAPQWSADGLAMCAAASDQQYPSIASDAAGGAFVAWQDFRSGVNFDIYAQRVNPIGSVLAVPVAGSQELAVESWPNPFNSYVSISFDLSATTSAHLEVFDLAGRRVWASPNKLLGPGRQNLTWDGRTDNGIPQGGGIYFLRVSGPGVVAARTVVHVK